MQGLAESFQLVPSPLNMLKVVIDLLASERSDADGMGQFDTGRQCQIVFAATADDDGDGSFVLMLLAIGVDGLDAIGARWRSDLVQAVEQGEDLIGVHPGFPDVVRNRVLSPQFFNQPLMEW